jgi:moderate conductance mechanosensitive channel
MNNQEQIHNLLSKFTPDYIGEKVVPGAINVIVILILTLIALRASKLISIRLLRLFQRTTADLEFQKRAETLGSVIRYMMNITTVSVAIIMILGELKINIAPVLATASIVGVAVGFGAQTLVQDVISGFFILLDDQIRVGDVVDIAGKSGMVEKVDLRMTTLRDMSGNVHYVRHGKIDVVTNMTKDFSNFVFDIPVSYSQNIDVIADIIREVHDELRKDPAFKDDILAPIEVLGLDRFAESAIIVRARTTTRPMKQWGVAREFNRRLKKELDARHIEMPFRPLMVYLGRDSEQRNTPLSDAIGTSVKPRDADDKMAGA